MNRKEKALQRAFSRSSAKPTLRFTNQLRTRMLKKHAVNQRRISMKKNNKILHNPFIPLGALGAMALVVIASFALFSPSTTPTNGTVLMPDAGNQTPDTGEQQDCGSKESGDVEDAANQIGCDETQTFASLVKAADKVPFTVFKPTAILSDDLLQKVTVQKTKTEASELVHLSASYKRSGVFYNIDIDNQTFEQNGNTSTIRFDGQDTTAYYVTQNIEGKASSQLTWSREGISYTIATPDSQTSLAELKTVAESLRAIQ